MPKVLSPFPALQPARHYAAAARRVALTCATAAMLLTPAWSTAWAAPVFEAVMLALPGQATGARAFGLSGGVVVGEVTTASGLPQATVWTSPQGPQTLPGGALGSTAWAVSGTVIAGDRVAEADATQQEALRWANAAESPTVLGSAGGGATARAVAGDFVAGALDGGAFVYQSTTGALSILDAPGAIAHGVDSSGTAVGRSAAGLPAVFRPDGSMTNLLGDLSGVAYGVLDGRAVGSYDDPDSLEQKAFLTLLDGTDTIDVFDGVAFALNTMGDVVGADFVLGLAMFYSGGTAWNLNDLVLNGLAGYQLNQARAIDDLGRIVAFGMNEAGIEQAFLLSPRIGEPPPEPPGGTVPVPPTPALVALALALMALRRRG